MITFKRRIRFLEKLVFNIFFFPILILFAIAEWIENDELTLAKAFKEWIL